MVSNARLLATYIYLSRLFKWIDVEILHILF